MLKKLAHFQVEHPYLSVLFLVALTLSMIGGANKVMTVASLEQMMPHDIEEIKAFNDLRDAGLGQDIIAIIIDLDPNRPENVLEDVSDASIGAYIDRMKNALALQSGVLSVQSMQDGPGFINDERTMTMMLITTDVAAHDERMLELASHVKETAKHVAPPPGTRVRFTGTPIIQQRLGELIARDRAATQWVSTILVLLITWLLFGTFTAALVPIVVVNLSVQWLYGTMGYTGLPISTLAGGVAAMVIGIGIDFAIHIMNKFKYERKQKKSIKHSIEEAVTQTGAALIATSLTTIAAFLTFLVGVMPEMGRFGILMAIGITYSLIFSLFGLPALLIIEEDLIKRVTKRAHFGVEGEYHLEK